VVGEFVHFLIFTPSHLTCLTNKGRVAKEVVKGQSLTLCMDTIRHISIPPPRLQPRGLFGMDMFFIVLFDIVKVLHSHSETCMFLIGPVKIKSASIC
jgi:hypothetical protein